MAALALYAHADEVKLGGTGSSLGAMQLIADAYQRAQRETTVVVLPSLGSSGGIKAVLAGAVHIALSARPLTPQETSAGASARLYARTPLAFATSHSSAAGLTLSDVADIYSAKRHTWPDGNRIRLVLRPPVEADAELVKGLSPRIREALLQAEKRAGMLVAVTDQDNADRLEKVPGALGAITVGQMLAERRALRALALDGFAPLENARANIRYPLMKPLYLVTGPATTPAARRFIAFIDSAPGRGVLLRTGHLLD